mmetsp:Transcript_108767/g.307512  ORF Transcript_108767/g.307512 Transcript_108767/m.307512 type:complete len:234 (+) Transcript_108767:91-792(+)
MAGRSSLLPSLLLLLLGALLGFGAVKGFDYYQEQQAAPAAEDEPAGGDDTPPEAPKAKGFLQDVRFTGSVSSKGWKTAATYTSDGGSKLKVSGLVKASGLEAVEAAIGYKAPNVQWAPDAELSATITPGRPGVRYSGKVIKKFEDGLEPTLVAEVTNSGASLGASVSRAITDDMDMAVNMKMPYTFGKSKVDLAMTAETSYKVGKGKVVGTLEAKASSGLKGTVVSADYDLGA